MSVKIVDTLVGVIHFAKFGSNQLLIVWELRKQRNANKCRKIAYSSVVKKMKNRNPRADPDHHQKSTTSRGSPLAHTKFGRRPFPRLSFILFTECQTEWSRNDRLHGQVVQCKSQRLTRYLNSHGAFRLPWRERSGDRDQNAIRRLSLACSGRSPTLCKISAKSIQQFRRQLSYLV